MTTISIIESIINKEINHLLSQVLEDEDDKEVINNFNKKAAEAKKNILKKIRVYIKDDDDEIVGAVKEFHEWYVGQDSWEIQRWIEITLERLTKKQESA